MNKKNQLIENINKEKTALKEIISLMTKNYNDIETLKVLRLKEIKQNKMYQRSVNIYLRYVDTRLLIDKLDKE